jgi:drug/metabolite transporter (DMT)-like permease
MTNDKKLTAILYAVLAAIFYAVSMPLSKLMLSHVGPTFMASFLYFGAGVGIGAIYLFGGRNRASAKDALTKKELPFVIGMIVLDIAAPVLLMVGLTSASSANASLLNNFEIVATSVIALVVFREAVSARLWVAIALITLSSVLLSFEDVSGLRFSYGSLFILAAAVCWGLENNCTRKISSKNTYQIVILKGMFSGLGSFLVAWMRGEHLPRFQFVVFALLLGFVAYGLSIFLYVRAQKVLGAAKTSAYYAVAPFVGALLSFLILGESVGDYYVVALLVMLAGSALVVADTLLVTHTHLHVHTISCARGECPDAGTYVHSHTHTHFVKDQNHDHSHKK